MYSPHENILQQHGLTFESTREAVAYDLNMNELGRFAVTAEEGFSVFDGRWSGVRLMLSEAVQKARATIAGAVYFYYEGEVAQPLDAASYAERHDRWSTPAS